MMIMMFFMSMQIFYNIFHIFNYILKCLKKNIIQISEFILHQL